MKVRITHQLSGSIDGIQLDHFKMGNVYDLGPTLASVFLAEQWAEPVSEDETPPPAGKAVDWDRPRVLPYSSSTVHDTHRPPRKKK
ncbi:MAG: hypothetical protein HY654_01815 [Acidobacteria bacterium]|nr:hypothetical protein [Acidobacteriota bacterium]